MGTTLGMNYFVDGRRVNFFTQRYHMKRVAIEKDDSQAGNEMRRADCVCGLRRILML